MTANSSSNKIPSNQNSQFNSESFRNDVRLFASKALNILETSENSLKDFFSCRNSVLLEENQQQTSGFLSSIRINQKEQNNESQIVTDEISLEEKSLPIKIKKNVFVGNLHQQRQTLMEKLRQVDRQIVQVRYGRQQDMKINRLSQLRQKEKTKKVLQAKNINTNAGDRTLDIIKNFNNQKIRRHEQLLMRIKRRQEEEMRKIEELQNRNNQMQLKKSQRQPSKKVKASRKSTR